jgi:hypothetical protein
LLGELQVSRAAAIVYTACLLPDHGLPAPELVRLVRVHEQKSRTWFFLAVLGAAQYRACQFPEAIASLSAAATLHGQDGDNWTKLFLAMAYHRQGQPKKAMEWFAKAKLVPNSGWKQRLIFDRLSEEAARLIKAGK